MTVLEIVSILFFLVLLASIRLFLSFRNLPKKCPICYRFMEKRRKLMICNYCGFSKEMGKNAQPE